MMAITGQSKFVLDSLIRYIPSERRSLITDMPLVKSRQLVVAHFIQVELPQWAADLGIGEPATLTVPAHCVVDGDKPEWQRTDWLRACFDMLTCQSEWQHEQKCGPVHSNSYRLPESIRPQFTHAWVNRIALFLRRWVAHTHRQDETDIFGERPKGKIYLTHDVDYISKTLALRIKQAIFILFNIVRAFRKADRTDFGEAISKLVRFCFLGGNYWQFENIEVLEKQYNVTSHWNIYGGKGGWLRLPMNILLDPAYKHTDDLSAKLKQLLKDGNTIGLHQCFHSWRDASFMKIEKERVEKSSTREVMQCRQHWLRFSFSDTWLAQENAGLTLDTTLGFNDRIAFRNGAAVKMPAWFHPQGIASDRLYSLPMVLMDSHLHDHAQMNIGQRRDSIDAVLNEIQFTGGEATVVWHQRVFHSDYGWCHDYQYLLEQLKTRDLI